MTPADEAQLVERLRGGDEAAFAALVDRHAPAMVRVARTYVPTHAVAEEVVQEAWIAVLGALDGFEGRSSLKTWVFRILVNVAMRRGERERRSLPFSSLAPGEEGPAVDPDRFLPADHDRWPGHWASFPAPWPTPEDGLLAHETRDVIARAMQALPEAQRTVMALRDVDGWSAEEVSDALEITPGNQRVLLHRARAKVRNAVEAYFGAVEPLVLPETTEAER